MMFVTDLAFMALVPAISAMVLQPKADNSFSKLVLSKRGTIWGPSVSLGPTKSEITKVVTTSYPGAMPDTQAGGLYIWPGISNTTTAGDLVQSIIGNYVAGASECWDEPNSDDYWCISSEVYGDNNPGQKIQFVGDKRTLMKDPSDGLTFTYTLVDASKYTWNQTVHNAKTGVLMATYQKNSGPMTGFGTAVECQSCTPTVSEQTYIDTVITLKAADTAFGETVYQDVGATNSAVTTSDGGVTWSIPLITIPSMT